MRLTCWGHLMFRRLLGSLALIFIVSAVMPASAADIRMSDHPGFNVILEGTITTGDYDKLRALIDENCPWIAKYCPDRIFLASPGGSLPEAGKIGRLIRKLRWGTEIGFSDPELRRSQVKALNLKDPQNNLCTSACFFIYVAGIERIDNPRFQKGILGIHRPYMSDADLKALSADQAMASATQVRTVVDAYLKEMGVPAKYSDLMFSNSRRSDQMD